MRSHPVLLSLTVLLALAASLALWGALTPSTPSDALHTGPVEPLRGTPMPRGPLAPPAAGERDDVAARERADGESAADDDSQTSARAGALPVRVVDTAGRPLGGIPVAIFARVPGMRGAMPVAEDETRATDGRAWLEAELRDQELPAELRLTAGVALPLEPPVERELRGWIPGEPWDGEAVELVLPDGAAAWLEPLQVVVVDARGEPVPGMDVELVSIQRLNPSNESQRARATTRAPDGVALLPLEKMLGSQRELAMLQVEVDHVVRCSGPIVPPPSVAVAGPPTSEPLRIVLPPSAAVEAQLVRPDGTRVERGASVSLEWYARGSQRREGYVNAAVEGGLARFGHVGLGLDLRLSGTLEGGTAHAAAVELRGPTVADATLEVELALGPDHPLLVGRLVAPGGEPAASMSFNLALDLVDPPARSPAAGRRLSWSYQQTDVDGRFAVPWGAPPTMAGHLLRFEERPHPQRGAPTGWIPHFAVIPFPALSPDGTRLDVGDVALEPVPVVVAGRVLDGESRPVVQAWLSLRYPEGEGRDTRWHNLPVPGVSRVPSREDGTFEVRSLQPMSVLRVSASQSRIGSSPTLEVAPGTTDVLLVLAPDEDRERTRGHVRGSVRVDEHIPMLELDVRLLAERADHSTIVVGGQFGFAHIQPGTYRLVVRTDRSDFLLEQVDGIVVQAGQVTQDPRLQGIDLRGRLRVLRARLLDPGGAPRARESVRLVAGEERARLSTDDEGRLMALVRSEDTSLQLHVPGCQPIEVVATGDEQVLTAVPE